MTILDKMLNYLKEFLLLFNKKNNKNSSQNVPPVPQIDNLERLQKVQNDIKTIYKEQNKDNEITEVCPNCHHTVKKNDIVKCAECGRVGCTECFIISPSSKTEGKTECYCDHCW